MTPSRTDSCGLADVDGQLGLLPGRWLVCTMQIATDQHILAHVDIARRVERHGGYGCCGMLGVWSWASLAGKRTKRKEVTLLAAEMRGVEQAGTKEKESVLIKSSNILQVGAVSTSTCNLPSAAVTTPDQRRNVTERDCPKPLSQGTHIPIFRHSHSHL